MIGIDWVEGLGWVVVRIRAEYRATKSLASGW
jgi:hypothetical protein